MRMVAIETDKGTITIELDRAKAEKSVDNFLAYVDEGFYDGLIFHRVIPGFMVQGGGFESGMKMRNPSRPNIQNEADNGLKNDRGTLAMARTSDPHSASSQFFINVADNDFLNHTGKDLRGWGYAVFGRVTDGMDVLDAIVALPTGQSGPHGDVPTQEIKIIRATRLDPDKSD
ncbi:MAG: peptidylprolyl isomerase [Candidatus Porifericomitaceae bacterium WSBS_2022_MAG_OTU9]